MLEEVQKISNLVNIVLCPSKRTTKGLGHAILCAKSFIGDEPFAVLLGDDIVMSETPCLKQIIDVFEYYNSSVVAVQRYLITMSANMELLSQKGTMIESNLFHIDSLIEKPNIERSPFKICHYGTLCFKS